MNPRTQVVDHGLVVTYHGEIVMESDSEVSDDSDLELTDKNEEGGEEDLTTVGRSVHKMGSHPLMLENREAPNTSVRLSISYIESSLPLIKQTAEHVFQA